MVVTVNSEVCIGCGMCVDMCEEVFKFNSDYKSEVVSEPKTPEICEKVKECVGICPVSAIEFNENNSVS